MRIGQHDIAQLDDDAVKRMAVLANDAACAGGPGSTFWQHLSIALVRAMQDRRRALLCAEADMLDDDEEGSLVADLGPADLDLISAAVRESQGDRHDG